VPVVSGVTASQHTGRAHSAPVTDLDGRAFLGDGAMVLIDERVAHWRTGRCSAVRSSVASDCVGSRAHCNHAHRGKSDLNDRAELCGQLSRLRRKAREDRTTCRYLEIRSWLARGEGNMPFGVRNGGTCCNVLDRAGDAASHNYRLGSAFTRDEKVPISHACLDQLVPG
jgi:hypothetical protein